MVFDRIEEQEKYYGLHPALEEAFAFLAEGVLMENGRYELKKGMYATISEGDTVLLEERSFEAHRKYLDLQYLFSGAERMAWAHIQELEQTVPYDAEKDCAFYAGMGTTVSVKPGSFYILFPSDGHKCCCHRQDQKHYRKIVVKIPVETK
jgi:biofilm protein TabA